MQPNHRGNDVMVLEDKPQVITARFMYGSYDVTSLSGEKVSCISLVKGWGNISMKAQIGVKLIPIYRTKSSRISPIFYQVFVLVFEKVQYALKASSILTSGCNGDITTPDL